MHYGEQIHRLKEEHPGEDKGKGEDEHEHEHEKSSELYFFLRNMASLNPRPHAHPRLKGSIQNLLQFLKNAAPMK